MKNKSAYSIIAIIFFSFFDIRTYADKYQFNREDEFQPNTYPTTPYREMNLNFTDPTDNSNLIEPAIDYIQEAPVPEQRPDKNTKSKQERIYNFPLLVTPTGKRTFIFNPNTYTWAAYNEKGQLIKQGPASGGAKFCKDINENCQTPDGAFNVIRKYGEAYKSFTFPIETKGGAPMPYAIFFFKGDAIHGSNYVPAANVSHGCIRVLKEDAKWLNKEFLDIGAMVIIYPYS